MKNEELDESFRRFYAEARTRSGEEYSRSSLLGFRNSVERYFTANNRSLKLTRNPVFSRSNKMLESKLKGIRREGKENTQHKPVIESEDLVKLRESPFMSPNTPDRLLRKVWFNVTLYWCCRGCEGQRLLWWDSFVFGKDADLYIGSKWQHFQLLQYWPSTGFHSTTEWLSSLNSFYLSFQRTSQ